MLTRLPQLAAVALGVSVLVLSACGDSGSSDSSSTATTQPAATGTPTSSGGSSVVRLSADPGGALSFDTDRLTAKAGTVTLQMVNPSGSGIPHAIAVEGNGVDKDGETAAPGGTSTVTLKLKPGTYTFYCPIPGHEDGGMKGTLTVT